MSEDDFSLRDLDLERPNSARVYDYYIGGNLNYAIDREFAEKIIARVPNIKQICRLNRAWLQRAVRFGLEQGIDQFLDIGSGMPTEGHVHEVAQSVNPEARVVYVDNERVAVAHSMVVLDGVENAVMAPADGERPRDVLTHPETQRLLDFSRPIMVIMAAFVHFIPPERDPAKLIATYRNALAPGSYLAVSSTTSEQQPEETLRATEMYKDTTNPLYPRTRAEVRGLMGDMELVEPGVVFGPEWRPHDPADVGEHPEKANFLAVVGRTG